MHKFVQFINFYLKNTKQEKMSESSSVKHYKKITRQQRFELLSLILEKKLTIKKAAEIIGIGASTARMILKKYEITGEVFESKADRRTRHIIEKIGRERPQPEPVCEVEPTNQQNGAPVTLVGFVYLYYPTDPLLQPTYF